MMGKTSRLSILLAGLGLLGGTATAQAPAGRPPSARDEAIPTLRDASIVVLSQVRIIDGTGAPAREGQSLVIESGRIRAVGKADEIVVPPGARRLDLPGATVLPGLVMLHEHLNYNAQGSGLPWEVVGVGLTRPQHFSFPRLYLAFGVTTIRTAGTDHPYMDLNLKRRIDAGSSPGPEIHLTSPFLSGEGDRYVGGVLLRNPDEAKRAVRYWAAEGFTSFKAYQWISKEALLAVVEEAHRLGLRVTAHLGRSGVSCREAAEMGIDNLEHGFAPCVLADGLEDGLKGPRTDGLLRALVERKVTLTVTYDMRGRPLSERARLLLDPSARDRYLSGLALRPPAPPRTGGDDIRESPGARLLRSFIGAGGRVVLGSDAGCCGGGNQVAGLASHHPLQELVRMGFSPVEVIRMGTRDGAAFLGIQDRVGTIEAGKEADLLVVRGDPSRRFEDLDNVEMVFANGVAFDPETLLKRVEGQVGWH